MARGFPSVTIENVQPLIDCGRYPIKRIVGEDLVVEADIFKDGHDVVAAILKWRVGKRGWRQTPMVFVDNDRWRGVCTFTTRPFTNTPSKPGPIHSAVGSRSLPKNLKPGSLICGAKR